MNINSMKRFNQRIDIYVKKQWHPPKHPCFIPLIVWIKSECSPQKKLNLTLRSVLSYNLWIKSRSFAYGWSAQNDSESNPWDIMLLLVCNICNIHFTVSSQVLLKVGIIHLYLDSSTPQTDFHVQILMFSFYGSIILFYLCKWKKTTCILQQRVWNRWGERKS